MKKIIITFDDEVLDIEAVLAVESVIEQGRISENKNGPCYCFVTTFKNGGVSYADRTKSGTDTFRITKPTGR
jgi:hypothetical protein